MVSWIISRLVVLIFGTLYPAYSSYKAVKSKDVKEYVKWMMYWITFALFTTLEAITDIFICWIPFYYELKIAFVVWLLSPYTKGSSVLYRKFVHPTLSSKEKDIDDYLCQAKDKSYDTLVHFGRKGLNVAATAAVMAASKGQGVLSDRLRSFSMQDLSSYQTDPSSPASVTTQSTAGQNRSRTMMRSKSECASSTKGQDFDMTEFELLSLDQCDAKDQLSLPHTSSESLTEPSSPTPSPTPTSSPNPTPSLTSTPFPPTSPTPPSQPSPLPNPPLPPRPSLSPPNPPLPPRSTLPSSNPPVQSSPTPPPDPPSHPTPPLAAAGLTETARWRERSSSSPQLRLSKRKAPEPPPRTLRPLTRSRSGLSSNSEAM